MRSAQKRGFDLNLYFVLLSATIWLIYALFGTYCMHVFWNIVVKVWSRACVHVAHDPVHFIGSLLQQVGIRCQGLFDRTVSQILRQGNNVHAVVDRIGGKRVPQIVQPVGEEKDRAFSCSFSRILIISLEYASFLISLYVKENGHFKYFCLLLLTHLFLSTTIDTVRR